MDQVAVRGTGLDHGAYQVFSRTEWAALRASTPLNLTKADLAALRGASDPVSIAEVEEVLLPLSRLVNLHVSAARQLATIQSTFLGRPAQVPPFVIALAGSVAVGKSTFARLLQAVLACWREHTRVHLVTTDGFLFPNRVLEERGLLERKGFPESYDQRRMISVLRAVKAAELEVSVPVYSHLAYDIVPGQLGVIRHPDILIFEGLNVLQAAIKMFSGNLGCTNSIATLGGRSAEAGLAPPAILRSRFIALDEVRGVTEASNYDADFGHCPVLLHLGEASLG